MKRINLHPSISSAPFFIAFFLSIKLFACSVTPECVELQTLIDRFSNQVRMTNTTVLPNGMSGIATTDQLNEFIGTYSTQIERVLHQKVEALGKSRLSFKPKILGVKTAPIGPG